MCKSNFLHLRCVKLTNVKVTFLQKSKKLLKMQIQNPCLMGNICYYIFTAVHFIIFFNHSIEIYQLTDKRKKSIMQFYLIQKFIPFPYLVLITTYGYAIFDRGQHWPSRRNTQLRIGEPGFEARLAKTAMYAKGTWCM